MKHDCSFVYAAHVMCLRFWINSIYAVNGGWSPWIMASNCSVPCGGGVQLFVRKCNNPVPANGGKDCEGPESKNESCGHCPCT